MSHRRRARRGGEGAPAVHVAAAWTLRERDTTPEEVFHGRRRFLARVGALGAAAVVGPWACGDVGVTPSAPPVPPDVLARYPAPRSARYPVDRALTPEAVAGRHTNFYEMSPEKERVQELARGLILRPWHVEVSGHVERPGVFDVDDLVRQMPLEERVTRFRCVEAWSMTVPWTGFPLAALLARAVPTRRARFVRFESVHRPEESPGMRRQRHYPWPYVEGLRLDEAMHDLAFLATGAYAHPLAPEHGAPIRLVVPWKYGFKSIKSIARIEVLDRRPQTFWNRIAPNEYGFFANVDPTRPHPRWSQAEERDIATGAVRPTLPMNGYAEHVADLYR